MNTLIEEIAHLLDIGYTDLDVLQENLMPLMENIVHDTSIFYTEDQLTDACQQARNAGYDQAKEEMEDDATSGCCPSLEN